jgi:aspartate racemase
MLGLIGGMSWESTALYYKLLNEGYAKAQGGLHSAPLLVWSFDFAQIAALQAKGDWEGATALMVTAGLALKAGGAKALVICTNTMHKMAREVEAQTALPVLHIVDATAQAIKAQGNKQKELSKIGLLATKFTMEQPFYKDKLISHGLEVITPPSEAREDIHRIIYEELCKGILLPSSKTRYLEIIDALVQQGAQGVILGCTEICLLIKQEDCAVPLFDTTSLHVDYALDWAFRP